MRCAAASGFALAVLCGQASATPAAEPYSEVVAERFTFGSNDYTFQHLPFNSVAGVARLTALQAVILTQDAALYRVDANSTVVGSATPAAVDDVFSPLSVAGLGDSKIDCIATIQGWSGSGFAAFTTDGTAWSVACSGEECAATRVAAGPAEKGLGQLSCAAKLVSEGRFLVAVGGRGGLWTNNAQARMLVREEAVEGLVVRSVAVHADDSGLFVAAATQQNVYLGSGALGGSLEWRREWATDIVSEAGGGVDSPGAHVAFTPSGDQLWVGGLLGLQSWDTKYRIFHRMQGLGDGLPLSTVTRVAASSGALWVGTTRGVARQAADGSWRYMYGPRWLPGTVVRHLVVMGSGSGTTEGDCAAVGDVTGATVVVTDAGVGVLRDECWNLDLKAAHYQAMVHPRHDRYGYVSDSGLAEAGNLSTYVLKDSDNDGLWTAMYTASQIFRAMLASSPEDRANAAEELEEHFNALMFLFDVTGAPGYMARSVVKANESHSSDRTWYNSSTAPGWIYKGDTSSDEVVGHMFFLPLLTTLLAGDSGAKPLVAEARTKVQQLMRRVVAHSMTLMDPETGEPTTWGHWDPATVNTEHSFADNRGLNSLEILAFLRAAQAVTGDAAFGDAADELKEDHGYGANVLNSKITVPDDVNFSDDELAFLPYYTHLVTADAGALDPQVVCSLSRSWREGVAQEHSALWATIHAAAARQVRKAGLEEVWQACGSGAVTTEEQDIKVALWSLRNWPLELITWPVTNSDRQDIVLDSSVDRFGRTQSIQVLPANERNQYRWNSNPHELDSTWPGATSEGDPGAWLLAFWMAKFHGLV